MPVQPVEQVAKARLRTVQNFALQRLANVVRTRVAAVANAAIALTFPIHVNKKDAELLPDRFSQKCFVARIKAKVGVERIRVERQAQRIHQRQRPTQFLGKGHRILLGANRDGLKWTLPDEIAPIGLRLGGIATVSLRRSDRLRRKYLNIDEGDVAHGGHGTTPLHITRRMAPQSSIVPLGTTVYYPSRTLPCSQIRDKRTTSLPAFHPRLAGQRGALLSMGVQAVLQQWVYQWMRVGKI
ncbi:hypothetical protein GALL_476700 [mine drainage metagenome]|uniref:Uncharacterized protein n=1 Tax=mine drainage metagenome TaxID=410659 RepID=A0A1J5PHL6_9ZZZZ